MENRRGAHGRPAGNVGAVKPSAALIAVFGLVAACTASTSPTTLSPPPPTEVTPNTPPTTSTTSPATTTTAPTTTTTISPFARPDWLGTRVLPLRPDGFGEIAPTPPELVNRQLETIDLLPPPSGADYEWTVGPVPDDVLARSSWREECPVGVDELAYLTVSHVGFDGEFHTGELIVNAAFADGFVEVFRRLHAARYPIEQMRVARAEEMDAPPTGDGNVTGSFECRTAAESENWSMHAYGLAIDINPFQNPYLRGDLVLPELASAYTDRSDVRPGMIVAGDAVTAAMADLGWPWGGNWKTRKDWMHFSSNGR
jgi:D-alanyl-D-alanine carboxypeptidase